MTRRAHGAICHCGAAILAGDDNDAAGLPARVDPPRLTRTGELLAVCAGRKVYELDLGRLYRRDRWMIHSPARGPVLAEHRCEARVPDDWKAPPAPAAAPPTTEEF